MHDPVGGQVSRPPGRLVTAVVPWLLWATLVYIVWTCFVVDATELGVQLGLPALVGFLVALAFGRGRHPQAAFLVTISLAFTVELWQHYGLHAGDMEHWLSWNDLVLNALGAAGGILPFVTLARAKERELPVTFHYVTGTVALCACLLLPVLLLDPQTTSWLLGHYRQYPFWAEQANSKPTHSLRPSEGIPLLLASILLLGVILEPRRRALTQGGLAVVFTLLAIAIAPASRREGTPVHEEVPRAKASWTHSRIQVDGVLEEAWNQAPRLGPFVENGSGAPAKNGETFARVLWDQERVYFAFEVTDSDVTGGRRPRDDKSMPSDEVVEVFLDDGGDEVLYFEVEVTPRNLVYDLIVLRASAPLDYDPALGFVAWRGWDAKGLETAVSVDGTLADPAEELEGLEQRGVMPPPLDTDRGYVVEIAIPWDAVNPVTHVPDPHRPIPPRPGDQWRLALYRADRPRVDLHELGAPDQSLKPKERGLRLLEATMSEDEARARLGLDRDAWKQKLEQRWLQPTEDGGALFLALDVLARAAQLRHEHQAWSPTWGPSFHEPQFFGVVEFEKPE